MKHRARKRFGQNFLVDQEIIARCIAGIAPGPGDLVVEIGPGLKALTTPLARSGAELVLVEIDRDLAARLAANDPPWAVLNRDALTVDFASLAQGRPYRLVGNLPYNISTPILFHLLAQDPAPKDMHFMLQKEVVERMAAGPGSKAYGRLSLTCRNLAEIVPLFEVPPGSFDPAPRVHSAFVRLLPRAQPLVDAPLANAFDRLVAQAFTQRRKTLRNSLRDLLDAARIEAADVDAGLRPEQLGLEDFRRLAEQLAAIESVPGTGQAGN